MIKFEELTENDINVFVDFHKKLNDLIGFKNNVLEDPEILELLKQSLVSEDNYTIIAKDNDTSIGLVSVDFSNELEFNGNNYTASIPLIYVEEKSRNGILSYDLLKMALKECKKRDITSVVISVEDNNPHKFLHFALADTIIDENKEYLTDDKTITQYILGISNIETLLTMPLSQLAKKISKTKKDFNSRLQELKSSSNPEKTM